MIYETYILKNNRYVVIEMGLHNDDTVCSGSATFNTQYNKYGVLQINYDQKQYLPHLKDKYVPSKLSTSHGRLDVSNISEIKQMFSFSHIIANRDYYLFVLSVLTYCQGRDNIWYSSTDNTFMGDTKRVL